jgi:hypothetical protein
MPGDFTVGSSRRIINNKGLWLVGIILIISVALLTLTNLNIPEEPVLVRADSDGDGHPETYQLAGGQVTVKLNQEIIWESDPAWKVTHLVLADADHDGKEEMLLVLWKEGSFGTSRPMWLEEEDNIYSNHLFMYRLVAGRMKPVWCSSAIPYPILQLKVEDYDGDSRQELLVTEGPASGPFYFIRKLLYNERQTIWQWQGWGFALVE